VFNGSMVGLGPSGVVSSTAIPTLVDSSFNLINVK
jgi:hypothetical protein